MKFVYEYRTKDNVRHEGVVEAATREDAFILLKGKGIRPGRVSEAPGFLNKLFGKGKRWLVIAALAVLSVVLAVVYFNTSRTLEDIQQSRTAPMPRHQIYGDPSLMGRLEHEQYASVFAAEGDRVLARFAQPGIYVRQPPSTERAEWVAALSNLVAQVDAPIGDTQEAREINELRRIVAWMRVEYRNYLANGIGTPSRFLHRLFERQDREFMIINRAKTELKDEKDLLRFERYNNSLRKLGLPTVAPPED